MKKFCMRFFTALLAAILGLILLGAAVPAASGLEAENGVSPQRILKIHKHAPEGECGSYEIYFVAALEDVLFGRVALGRTPSDREIVRYKTREKLVATVKTDAAGEADWNLTAAGFGDGVYLVTETGENPASAPFYVCVPCADPGGEGWPYTVDVYPRVSVPGPAVAQEIQAADGEILFRIRGEVPGNLYSGGEYAQCYRLADVLDPGLDYQECTGLCLLDRAGKELTLTVEKHYALAEIPAEGDRGARVAVSLTEEGMHFIAGHLGTGSGTPELRLSYRAVVRNSVDGEIYGNARLEYTDASGYEYLPARVSGKNRPCLYIGDGFRRDNSEETADFRDFLQEKD